MFLKPHAGLFGEAEKEVFGPFPADRMRAGPIDMQG